MEKKTQSRKTFIDKRGYQRKPCPGIKVTYSFNDRLFNDPINDISEDGMFIKTDENFPAGNDLTLTFMSMHKKGPLLMKGAIVRSEENGIGVQFFDTNDIQKNALNTLMNGYLI